MAMNGKRKAASSDASVPALLQARRYVDHIMGVEGHNIADVERLGIPGSSLRFFLRGGNVTIGALHKMLEAMGYELEVKVRRKASELKAVA